MAGLSEIHRPVTLRVDQIVDSGTRTEQGQTEAEKPSVKEILWAIDHVYSNYWRPMALDGLDLAARERFERAIRETVESGVPEKTTWIHGFTDSNGKRHRITRGIPVNELKGVVVNALENPDLTDQQRIDLDRANRILWWNESILASKKRNNTAIQRGLIHQRAKQIIRDPRIPINAPDEAQKVAEDQIMAERDISIKERRRRAIRSQNSPREQSTSTRSSAPYRRDNIWRDRVRDVLRGDAILTSTEEIARPVPHSDNVIKEELERHYTRSRNAQLEAERLRTVRDRVEMERKIEESKKKAWDAAFEDAVKATSSAPVEPTEEIKSEVKPLEYRKSYDEGTITSGSEEPEGSNPFDETIPDQAPAAAPSPVDISAIDRLRAVREQLQQELIGAHSHIWTPPHPFDTGTPHTPTPIPDKAIPLGKFEAWPRKEEETAPHPIYFGVIADRTSDLKKRAREAGREHVRAQMADGNIFNNAWKKIVWRQVESLMVDKFTADAEKYLLEAGDIYATIDWEKKKAISTPESQALEHDSALAKINSLISRAESSPGVISIIPYELKQQIINHIARIVGDEESDRQFQDALRALLRQYRYNPPEYLATDLLELTRKMKTDIAEGKILPELAFRSVEIGFADADWASEEKERLSVSSKAVEKIQKTRLGYGVNPGGIGIVSSIGIFAAKGAIGWGAKTAAALPLVGAIPGGAYAYFRSKAEYETDMPMHRRDKVYGGKLLPRPKPFRFWEIRRRLREGGLARRWELEDLRPSTVSTTNLLGQNYDLSDEAGRNSQIDILAEIRARLEFSKAYGYGLITYSSRYTVEQEKLQLEEYLKGQIAALEKAGMQRVEIENQIEIIKSQWNYRFLHNVESQQIKFERQKFRKAIKAGAVGAAVGATVGATVHDLLVGLGRAFEYDAGSMFIESLPPLAQGASAASPRVDMMPSVPKGMEWIPDEENSDLVDKKTGETLLDNVRVGKNGQIHFDKATSPLADYVEQEKVTTSQKFNRWWKEHSTQVDHRDFVRNGTVGVYEKGELDMFVGKKGEGVIITLPKGADGILITKGGDLRNAIWVPADHGRVVLSPNGPNAEIAKALIDFDKLNNFRDGGLRTEEFIGRRGIFRICDDGQNGLIQAAKLNESGGKTDAKVFATIQGSGPVPSKITEERFVVNIKNPIIEPEPTPEPTPTPRPTPIPTTEPTPQPTATPTAKPTPIVTFEPTPEPTPIPTDGQTPVPTATATLEPAPSPTPKITESPSPEPTPSATPIISPSPTIEPTPSPSPEPVQPLSGIGRIGETYIIPAVAVPFYPRMMPSGLAETTVHQIPYVRRYPEQNINATPVPIFPVPASAPDQRTHSSLAPAPSTGQYDPARERRLASFAQVVETKTFIHEGAEYTPIIVREGNILKVVLRSPGKQDEIIELEEFYRMINGTNSGWAEKRVAPVIQAPPPVQRPIQVVQQSRIRNFFSKIKNFLFRRH